VIPAVPEVCGRHSPASAERSYVGGRGARHSPLREHFAYDGDSSPASSKNKEAR
jgi:hypothetical protein